MNRDAASEPADSPSSTEAAPAAGPGDSASQPPRAGQPIADQPIADQPTAVQPAADLPGAVQQSDAASERPADRHAKPAGASASLGDEGSTADDSSAAEAELPASQSLAEAIGRLGLDISADKIAKLDEYCQRLWELNQHINLTRHTTYDLFARRDLLDTYELSKFIDANEEVLDIGTGGGVPGIPLAILRPDLKVSLCDSVAKKARAAETLVSQLKLPVYVHALRVQDVLEDHSFDTLVTRAVGSITQLCNWLKDNWHCFNRLLAIKGPRWVEERKEARHRGVLHGTVLRRIHGYRMPGTKSESVILQLHRPRPGSAS